MDDDGLHESAEVAITARARLNPECRLRLSIRAVVQLVNRRRHSAFSRRVSADDRALDRAGQPGVDPVAGEEEASRRASSLPGARGWPGASENVACFSRTTVARDQRGAARAGQRLLRPRARRARQLVAAQSPSAASRRSRRATGATRRRRTPAACRTPTASRARAARRTTSSITRRSYHRFTVTIGIDVHRVAAASDRLEFAAAVAAPNSVRSANHGTAATTCGAVDPLAADLDAATRPSSTTTRASAFTRTSPPRASMKCARRLRIHLVQRLQIGSTSEAAVRIGAEHLGEHAHEGRGRGQIGRLIQRRDRQRLPQPRHGAVARCRAPSATPTPCRVAPPTPFRCCSNSLRARRSGPASFRRATADRATASRPNRGRRRAGAAATAGQGTTGPIAARRDRGTPPPADGCTRTLSERVDPPQELERLPVAAEEHVLAVVHELAGLAIDERRRAAAELRPRVERRARVRRARRAARRGAQAGEAAADDDDVRRAAGSRLGSVIADRRPFGPTSPPQSARAAAAGCGRRG